MQPSIILPHTRSKGCGVLGSPTVLIMDKILKKKTQKNSAQFMFFTPNEVRNSRQAPKTFSVYWNLISVKFSSFIVTVLAEFCLVLSCIVLSLCYIFIADNTDGTKKKPVKSIFFLKCRKKWKFTWKTLKLLKYPLKI